MAQNRRQPNPSQTIQSSSSRATSVSPLLCNSPADWDPRPRQDNGEGESEDPRGCSNRHGGPSSIHRRPCRVDTGDPTPRGTPVASRPDFFIASPGVEANSIEQLSRSTHRIEWPHPTAASRIVEHTARRRRHSDDQGYRDAAGVCRLRKCEQTPSSDFAASQATSGRDPLRRRIEEHSLIPYRLSLVNQQ